MNPLYQSALNGTLKSTKTGGSVDLNLTNKLPFAIRILYVGYNGVHKPMYTIAPGGGIQIACHSGDKFWLQNTLTGSFVGVVDAGAQTGSSTGTGNAEVKIDYRFLTLPNDIGELPKPTRTRLIPPNSTLVLVGCGTMPNGNIVLREQYWLRQPDSFSLAAGESKTSSISISRGLQETSSDTETVAASLGVSGSAGWGPISASVSASINASATFSQQVSVSEQTTAYESKTFTNQLETSVMFLSWQLVDVITVYDPAQGVPVATMSSSEPPGIIDGPFDPDNLPDDVLVVTPPSPVEDGDAPQAAPAG